MSDMRNDADVQDAARALFLGCAPERHEELEKLWAKFGPEFQVHDDNHPDGPFLFDAGAYKYVRFNHRAMQLFWLGAFIAWEGFCATPMDYGTAPDWSRLNAMLSTYALICDADDPEGIALPEGVPQPGVYIDAAIDSQARAVAELATIAAGWALLHEFRHIQHQQDGTAAPTDDEDRVRAEEASRDAFATNFLTEKIGHYAAATHDPIDKVKQKRQLGIYLALFNIALLTKDHWGETNTHPALRDRIEAAKVIFGADRHAGADHVAEVAFAALGHAWPGAPAI